MRAASFSSDRPQLLSHRRQHKGTGAPHFTAPTLTRQRGLFPNKTSPVLLRSPFLKPQMRPHETAADHSVSHVRRPHGLHVYVHIHGGETGPPHGPSPAPPCCPWLLAPRLASMGRDRPPPRRAAVPPAFTGPTFLTLTDGIRCRKTKISPQVYKAQRSRAGLVQNRDVAPASKPPAQATCGLTAQAEGRPRGAPSVAPCGTASTSIEPSRAFRRAWQAPLTPPPVATFGFTFPVNAAPADWK